MTDSPEPKSESQTLCTQIEINSVKWRVSICETGAAVKHFSGLADCGTVHQKKDVQSAVAELEKGDSSAADRIARTAWKFISVSASTFDKTKAMLLAEINNFDFAAHEREMKRMLYKSAGMDPPQ
jgi:hypothetical protein